LFKGCADKLSRKTSGKQNCAEVVEQDKNALSDFITAKQQLVSNPYAAQNCTSWLHV